MPEEKSQLTEKKLDFDQMRAEEVLKLLMSNQNTGLTSAEVEHRLKQYGYNEVLEKKANPLIKFVKNFWGLTAWMLEVIIILSWILQRYSDLYIVSGLLVFNSILGFAEEEKASSAVEVLKKKLEVNAKVQRDNSWRTISARDLVPGDIIRIRSGDFIPADAKIITGEIAVDQSALTGESREVEKKPDDALFSGSVAKRGEANCIVVLTGVETFFGRTAQLVQIARPKLHMEEVVSNVVKWLLAIVSALVGLTLIFSFHQGFNLFEILPIVLVLLLSAIPVALPAMFTISMAVGSMELIKKGILVTRLSASEDAANMDILCADKTGTITMNKLSVADVIPLSSFAEKEVIFYGTLASQEANQDPIDLAFIAKAKEKNLIDDSFVQEIFVPFDPQLRRTEALIRKDGREFKVMKGAVSVIAKACGLDESAVKELEEKTNKFAIKGYRTLAVAKADDNDNHPELVGLVALSDMPRPDSKELIMELKELGVSVKMLTGDALPVAKEIAKDVSLGENIIKVSDFKDFMKENPVKAAEEAQHTDGFAEIYPEDKYTIVQSLQATKHVIGMTGDGVNDAPALRQAEVGIAVSNATDVAKGAASIVLTREGLTGIVDLVKNGRVIYARLTSWILSKIIRTLQIAVFVVLSFLFTGSYVVSAFAVILYFFMTDFVKISLSTDNVQWSRKPDAWNIAGLVKISTVLSFLIIAESFGLLYIGFHYFHLPSNGQTLYTFTFEILFYSAMFLIFNVREKRHFWNSRPSKTLLIAITLSMMTATVIATVGIPGLEPLSLSETFFVILYSAAFSLGLNDAIKFSLVKRTKISW